MRTYEPPRAGDPLPEIPKAPDHLHHAHHAHGAVAVRLHALPARQRRALLCALGFLVALTVVGLVALWPGRRSGDPLANPTGAATDLVRGRVTAVTPTACEGLAADAGAEGCVDVEVRLASGPERGTTVVLPASLDALSVGVDEGDRILLVPIGAPGRYAFYDFERKAPLLFLAAMFVAAVLVIGRWRGARSLAGLALSMAMIIGFLLPAILDGSSPVLAALVTASVIVVVGLSVSHGFTVTTIAAIIGTLVSLLLTGILSVVFVELCQFTGLISHEASYLRATAGEVDLRGLLLGGIIIGALGVLDDVTITQASAVWELHQANPLLGRLRLYRAAMRIGRDHIGSTVNTLALAYAGAALPLLLLFTQTGAPLSEVVTGEAVATEIVRTLVGSIGLMASVPVSTGLATFFLGSHTPVPAAEPPSQRARRLVGRAFSPRYRPPRREREWQLEEYQRETGGGDTGPERG